MVIVFSFPVDSSVSASFCFLLPVLLVPPGSQWWTLLWSWELLGVEVVGAPTVSWPLGSWGTTITVGGYGM